MKRLNLEKIDPLEGSSFYMTHNKAPLLCHEDFWHFHPEFEIVYIPAGNGKRFIGEKMSRFSGGDLILLGPNIPHNAFNFGFESPDYEEYVIQFKGHAIEQATDRFPEFSRIARLLAAARTGLSFPGETKHTIGRMITEMYTLNHFERLLRLFAVLRQMSGTAAAENLGAASTLSVPPGSLGRIEKVYRQIELNFHHDTTTREMAALLAMTETSFCRFFRRTTGKTFKEALTETRIRKACNLLHHSDLPVATIATKTGFNNISLFNRFFKEAMKSTPNAYRQSTRVPALPSLTTA